VFTAPQVHQLHAAGSARRTWNVGQPEAQYQHNYHFRNGEGRFAFPVPDFFHAQVRDGYVGGLSAGLPNDEQTVREGRHIAPSAGALGGGQFRFN
jgi:hypothetical protein